MALYRPTWRAPDGKWEKSPFYHFDFVYHGKRYRGSTEEKAKPKAREVESRKRQEARASGAMIQIQPIGFTKFSEKYLELHGNTKRAATFYDFTVRILKRHFEKRLLASITPLDCADFMAKRRAAVKPSTANSSLTVLKHLFRMAEEWGYLAEGTNPARKLRREKVRNSRDRYLSTDEAEGLLNACTDWLRPIVLMALHTGGRRAELLGLTWADVDFSSGTVRFGDTKNGEARKIPMSQTLASTLRALPNRLKGGAVFYRDSEPVTAKVLRSGFEAAVTKAKIAGFRFHDLRHTWATHLAMDGLPMRTLQELGGWKRPEMVQRYAAVSPASKERAAEALDRIFSSPPPDPHQQKGQQEAGTTA